MEGNVVFSRLHIKVKSTPNVQEMVTVEENGVRQLMISRITINGVIVKVVRYLYHFCW